MTLLVQLLRNVCSKIEHIIGHLPQETPLQAELQAECETLVRGQICTAVETLRQILHVTPDSTRKAIANNKHSNKEIYPDCRQIDTLPEKHETRRQTRSSSKNQHSGEKEYDLAKVSLEHDESSSDTEAQKELEPEGQDTGNDPGVHDVQQHMTEPIPENTSNTTRKSRRNEPGESTHSDDRSTKTKKSESNQQSKSVANFTCTVCNSKLTSKDSLRKHLKIHTDEKDNLCVTCGKSYKTPSHLKEHIRIHTGEKPFVCSVCGKAFTQAGARKAHERAHKNAKQYQCYQCNKTYRNKCSLTIHMRNHTGINPYKCKDCGKAFKQHQGLVVHMRIHSGERPFLCGLCGQSFTAAATYRKHKLSHQATTPYHCDECNKYFTTITKLKSHRKTHRRIVLVCEFCGGKFKSDLQLENHTVKCQRKSMEQVARKDRPRRKVTLKRLSEEPMGEDVLEAVQVNPIDYKTEANAADPKEASAAESKDKTKDLENTAGSQFVFQCAKCSYHFPSEETLEQHQHACLGMPTLPDSNLSHVCSYCGAQYHAMHDYLNHIDECYATRCAASTALMSYPGLEASVMAADSQDTYSCFECRVRFSRLEDLDRHYESCFQTKSIDLSNVPYKCTYCGNLYVNMVELSKHEADCAKAHGMNFTCANCMQRFVKLEELDCHQVLCSKTYHHVDRKHLFRCAECNVDFNTEEELIVHQNVCARLSSVECMGISYQ